MKQNVLKLSQLDVMRGVAAVFMAVNHAGVALLTSSARDFPITNWLVFVGSYAPVLFFFITGVGYGLKSSPAEYYPVFYKAIVLIVADRLMFARDTMFFGLDFLGFIGLSMMVLCLIQRKKHSIALTFILLSVITIVKFIADPLTRPLEGTSFSWLSYALGSKSIKGFSYPIFPWLAMPLLGFLWGKFLTWKVEQRISAMFTIFCVSTIFVVTFWYFHVSFFRWGIMSEGFYISCFSVLSITWLCVELFVSITSKNIQNIVSLKGISSLSFVPIHYGVLHLLQFLGFKISSFAGFVVFCVGFTGISFALSKIFSTLSMKYKKQNLMQDAVIWGIVISILSFEIAVENEPYALKIFGQLICCILLISIPKISFAPANSSIKKNEL